MRNIKDMIKKSGTSIVGIVCKDGIVMASDRQVTGGNIVLQKNERKIIKINDYLALAWTGVVSDAQLLKKIIAAELKLKELQSGSRPSVKEAANLLSLLVYRNIRQLSSFVGVVGVLVGGVNEDGTTELYSIDPSGAIMKVEDYDANFGSGLPYILGVLEAKYKEDIKVKDGIDLAIECLKASTERDIGSGYGIDVFTITKDGIKHVVSEKIISSIKKE